MDSDAEESALSHHVPQSIRPQSVFNSAEDKQSKQHHDFCREPPDLDRAEDQR